MFCEIEKRGKSMDNEAVKKRYDAFCESIHAFSECMNDYLYVYDLVNDSYCISEKALERFDLPGTEFGDVIAAHGKFVYKQDLKMLTTDLNRMKDGLKETHNLDYRWVGKDKEPIWINCRGAVIRDEDGRAVLMVGCINEIGKRQKADNVSGLLETSSIKMVLDGFFKICPTGQLIRIGIDDFKEINEKFGADYGDFILKSVANAITEALVPGQEVYRAGSDEYMVCDFIGGSKEDAKRTYKRIRVAIDDFIRENHYKTVFTISAGILAYNDVGKADYNEIMKLSSYALMEAKKRGKNQAAFFNKEDYEAFLKRRELLTELKRSVANGCEGFQLYFQPIMHETVQGRIFAAEALLRFRDSQGHMVPPTRFVPVLEESGLIIPVGRFVIEEAAKTCKECRRVNPDFKVSVNLSYVQILKSSVLEAIFSSIAECELEPSSMIIELTESGYVENTPAVHNVWKDLRDHGVLIALDDFGTGYSNIQSISKLTPNIVKIDRDFTVKALNNEFERRLLESIIELVHSIDLKICIEGIETLEELEKIQKLKPDYIQGFFYGKPAAKSDFMKAFF